MLKHVSASQLSPYNRVLRAGQHNLSIRPDTVSLASFGSNGGQEALSSRSSSTSSIHDTVLNHLHKTVIKIYARVLCSDMEYKTVSVAQNTTSKEVVRMLLGKFRMKHRDPNLFYLTMEVSMRMTGNSNTGVPIRTIMVLDEDAKPAELQACHPKADSRFCLQMHNGGLVKIYDGCLMPGSMYKSLLVSERTTVEELIQLILHCDNSKEWAAKFSLFEVCTTQKYERRLHTLDLPLTIQQGWPDPDQYSFQLKRNSDISPNKKIFWSKLWSRS